MIYFYSEGRRVVVEGGQRHQRPALLFRVCLLINHRDPPTGAGMCPEKCLVINTR